MTLRVLAIRWTFWLATQLVALGYSFRLHGVASLGMRVLAWTGIIVCVLGFANAAGNWKGKRDAAKGGA